MQGFLNGLEIKRSATFKNHVYTLLYKNPMVTTNQKSVIYIDTERKRNLNITLKIVNKITREQKKKGKKDL